MHLSSLRRYFDPVILHRDLEPGHLTQEIDSLTQRYAATDPDERTVTDAAVVGALKGLRFSRQHLDYVSGPADVVLGNGNPHPPNAKQGVVGRATDIAFSAYFIAVVPRLANSLIPIVKSSCTYIAERQGMQRYEIDSFNDEASKIIAGILVTAPQVAGCALTTPSIYCSIWGSGCIKLAVNAPAALLGATLGALQHSAAKRVSAVAPETLMTFGDRGARNEETFALLEPLSSVSDAFFFLSEDKFGFDVRELALLAQSGRPGLNPHTNTRFSERDIERLVAHPSGLFGEQLPSERLNSASFLAPWQWVRLFPFFIDVSRALQAQGIDNQDLRRRGAHALRELLRTVDPLSRVDIELFYQSISGYDVSRLLREIEGSEASAYDFGERLHRATMSIGGIQASIGNQPTPENYADALRDLPGHQLDSGILDLCLNVRGVWALSQVGARAERDHALLRHPWLRAIMPPHSSYPTDENVTPINLDVPVLEIPFQRQIILNYLRQGDDGTRDIAAMLRAEIGR